MGLGQFDAAKDSYETLRTLGDNTTADSYLKKLDDAQERDTFRIVERFSLRLKLQSEGYKIDLFKKRQNASNTKCPEKK